MALSSRRNVGKLHFPGCTGWKRRAVTAEREGERETGPASPERRSGADTETRSPHQQNEEKLTRRLSPVCFPPRCTPWMFKASSPAVDQRGHLTLSHQ